MFKGAKIGKTIKIFGKCLVAVISGICISGVVFVPACYYVTTNSSRLNGATSAIFTRLSSAFIHSFNFHEFGSRLSRLVSNNLICINDDSSAYFANYYEAPQLFCTIFIFFFFGQWIVHEFIKVKNERTWVSFIVKCMLFCFLLFNSASGLILNGFAYPAYRYTFVLFPFFGLCIGSVWEEVISKKNISKLGIGIGIFLSAFTWIYSYRYLSAEVKNYAVIVLCLLLMGFIMLLYLCFAHKYDNTVMLWFAALVISATVLDNAVTTNYRTVVTKDNYSLDWDGGQLVGDTAVALEWLRSYDQTFYRLEKLYTDWSIVSDQFIEEYSSVAWYNSTANVNVLAFYDHIYYNATGDAAIKLFKLDTDLDRQAINIANIKYLLSKNEMESDSWELINHIGSVYVYKNRQIESVAKWYGKSITKEDFEALEESEKVNILMDTLVVDDAIVMDEASKATVDDFLLTKQTELTGNVICDGSGVLMLSVPYQEGWDIYVDGKRVDTYIVDYGFQGIKLDEGEHVVTARYSIPNLKIGMIISLIGVLLTTFVVWNEKR